jgi:hypothetical protein
LGDSGVLAPGTVVGELSVIDVVLGNSGFSVDPGAGEFEVVVLWV